MKRKQERKSTSFGESENDSNIRTTRRSTRLSKNNSPNNSLIIEDTASNLSPQKCRNKKEKVIQIDKSPKLVKKDTIKTQKVLNVKSKTPKAGSTRRSLRKRTSLLEEHQSKEESLDVKETQKQNVVLSSERHDLSEVTLDNIEDTKVNEISKVLEMSETEENLKEKIEHHETTDANDIKQKVSNIDIINSPKVRCSRDSKATINNNKDYVDNTAQSVSSFKKEPELNDKRLDTVEYSEKNLITSAEEHRLSGVSLDNIEDTKNVNELSSEGLKMSENEESLKTQIEQHETLDIEDVNSILEDPELSENQKSQETEDETIKNVEHCEKQSKSSDIFNESDLEIINIDYENDILSDNEDFKQSNARNCTKEDEESLMEVKNSDDNVVHDSQDEYKKTYENSRKVVWKSFGSDEKFSYGSSNVFNPVLNSGNNIKETIEKMDEGNENTNKLSPLIRNGLLCKKIKLPPTFTGKQCHFTKDEEHYCLICDSPKLDSHNFVKHIQKRQHILRCLEIFNKRIYRKYADDIKTSTSELYRIALEKEALWPWTNAENDESKIISNVYETLQEQYSSKSSTNMDTFSRVFLLGNSQFYYTLQELEKDEKLHNNLTILSESDLFLNNLIDYFERSSNSLLDNALWVIFVGFESVFKVKYFASVYPYTHKYPLRSLSLNARFLKPLEGNSANLSLINTMEEFVDYLEYIQTRIKKMLGQHSNVVLIPFEPALFKYIHGEYNELLASNVITCSVDIIEIYNTLSKMFISLIHPEGSKELKRFKYYLSSITSFLAKFIPSQKPLSHYRDNLTLLYKDKGDDQHDDNVKNIKFDYFIFVGPHYIRYVIPNDPRFLFAREKFPFTRRNIDDLLYEYDRSREKRILIILIVDVTVLGTNEILEFCQHKCESKLSFVNIECSALQLKENSCISNVQHIREIYLKEKGVLVMVAPLFPKLYISDKDFLENHREFHGLLECNYKTALIKCNGTDNNDFKKAAVRFNLKFFNGFGHLRQFKECLPSPLCEVFFEYDDIVDQWMTELYHLVKLYDNTSPYSLGKGNKSKDFIHMSETTDQVSSTPGLQSAVERAKQLAKKCTADGETETNTVHFSKIWQPKSDDELIGSFVGRSSLAKNVYDSSDNKITHDHAPVNTSNALCDSDYHYSLVNRDPFGLKELQDSILTGKGPKRKNNYKDNANQKKPKIGYDTNSYTSSSLGQQFQPPYATASNFATQNPQQFAHSYYGQATTMQQFGSVGPTNFTPTMPPAQPYGSAMALQPQHSFNMYASPVQQNVPNQNQSFNMYSAPMQQNVPNQSQSFNMYSAPMQQNVPNQSQSFNMYASPAQHNVPNQGHSSLTNLNVSQNNDNMYSPFQEETSVPSLRGSSDIRGASTDNNGGTTEEIEKYIQMPNLHPDFIVQYQTFISQDPSHKANNAYIKQKWESFWRGYLTSKRVSSIGNSEAVADKSIGKIKAVAPTDIHKGLTSDAASSSNLDESKVFEDLIMMNNFSKNLFYLGKDLDYMVLKSLELGTDDEKVLSFLGNDLNVKILHDISLSIKNATNIPPNQQGLYKKASETITNLLRKIELKTDLDISDIAKIAEATVGKDSSVIRHVIETSLKGHGHASPSSETVNKIYLEVCSHHFRIAIDN